MGLAARVHKSTVAEPPPQQLLFETARGAWGVPQVLAEEIVELGHPREVPATPPHVRGLLVLRGEVLPVVDLDVLGGAPPGPLEARGVLLRTTHGALVLILRKVLGFEAPPAGVEGPAAGATGLDRHLRGPVALGSRQVRLLDPEGLGAWLEEMLERGPPCP
jgi:two-component system, chemotaxis family, chemotaxis protein CheV